ncbi:MAG: phospholipase [Firmicutes bacterium HGW-Firmicutes-1]|nr:MAG: phospholipase [Firmicutes bacterium HGW-Firmicutes-1]
MEKLLLMTYTGGTISMKFELFYGNSMRILFALINPIKKMIIHTECQVHLFNNIQALRLLREYNYNDEYKLMKKYIKPIQLGSVWADQNFKSSSHFYNPKNRKGLFGHSHALTLAETYYNQALHSYIIKDYSKAMFYFGACIHIIQDLTIPQHVRIRLLDNHRSYENFVKYTFDLVREYRSVDPPIVLNDVKSYLEYNARIALRIDREYRDVQPLKIRFFKMTLSSLPLAQSTSAGCMVQFMKDIKKHEKSYVRKSAMTT